MSPSPTCVRCQQPLPAGYDPVRPCPACLFALGLGPLDDEEAALLVHTGAGEVEPPPEPHELADLFPQLEILELLGQGGMGAVYRARQTDLDRDVALKILSPRVNSDPAFAERFSREARALARLSHPNIVAVHDFGRSGPHYYLVMELVDGTNLRHLIRSKELAPRQALEIVEHVCAALQYAHDEGVVHRDIKPENILLDHAGRTKIVDFGLAKMGRGNASVERLTRTQQAMGTPQYMAPEQIERPLEVDHRADIYSLGVVFYELLTGELPIGRFAPPSRKVQVDVRLDEVVLRALEKEPEQRYQQASEVATDLDGIKRVPPKREPPHRDPVQPPRREPPARSGIAWGWVAVIVLLVLAAPLGCAAFIGAGLVSRSDLVASSEGHAAELEAESQPRDPGRETSVPERPRQATVGASTRSYGLATVLGLGALVVFCLLVFLAVRGIRARRQRGGGFSWAWLLLILMLLSCVPLSCFAFLIPATRMAGPRATEVAPPRPLPDPAPAHAEAPLEEPILGDSELGPEGEQ